jgi:phosphoglycolate phosphatase
MTTLARQVVIFDLDGTLVDTIPDIAAALGRALEGTGVAPPPLEVVKRMVGDGARELVRRALAAEPADSAREEAVLARLLAAYRENACVASRLYPDVADGLAALRGDGVALAVVTNKLGDVARTLLGTLGIAASFEAIIGDGDGFPRKPDPAAARSVLLRVGGAQERTAVVGDGLPDMRLARALGATAVAATWGYAAAEALAGEGPQFSAGSFSEAVSIVRRLAAG